MKIAAGSVAKCSVIQVKFTHEHHSENYFSFVSKRVNHPMPVQRVAKGESKFDTTTSVRNQINTVRSSHSHSTVVLPLRRPRITVPVATAYWEWGRGNSGLCKPALTP
jgi:hypothetical protein